MQMEMMKRMEMKRRMVNDTVFVFCMRVEIYG